MLINPRAGNEWISQIPGVSGTAAGLTGSHGRAAAAIVAVGHDGQNAGPGPGPVRRCHLDREAKFVAGPVDPDLVADHEHGQKPEQTGPFADETQAPPTCFLLIALHRSRDSVKPAR